jgi:hypothetical protein
MGSLTPTLWTRLEKNNVFDIGAQFIDNGTPNYVNGYWSDALGPGAGEVKTADHRPYVNMPEGTLQFAWKPETGWSTTVNYICAFRTNASTTFIRLFGSTNQLFCDIYASATSARCAVPDSAFVVGTWYNIAFVWKRTGIDGGSHTSRLYSNDVLLANSTADYGGNAHSTVPEAYIGSDWTGANRIGANIDNVKIFDVAKTTFEDMQYQGLAGQKRRAS